MHSQELSNAAQQAGRVARGAARRSGGGEDGEELAPLPIGGARLEHCDRVAHAHADEGGVLDVARRLEVEVRAKQVLPAQKPSPAAATETAVSRMEASKQKRERERERGERAHEEDQPPPAAATPGAPWPAAAKHATAAAEQQQWWPQPNEQLTSSPSLWISRRTR